MIHSFLCCILFVFGSLRITSIKLVKSLVSLRRVFYIYFKKKVLWSQVLYKITTIDDVYKKFEHKFECKVNLKLIRTAYRGIIQNATISISFDTVD